MAALTKDRNTPSRGSRQHVHPVAANVRIHAGALVVLGAGFAEPGTTAVDKRAAGRAAAPADNTGGAAGDVMVTVDRGEFLFANDGSITQAHVGGTAYIVDDQTVAATDGGGTRSPAGTIRGIETGGVWVEI